MGRPVTLNTGFSLPDFEALLASREFAYQEAFTLRLITGTNKFYTDAQQDFTVPPCDGSVMLQTYSSKDVLIAGLRFKVSAGSVQIGGDPTASIEVDEQSLTITPNVNADAPTMLDGVPFLTAVGRRALDGATIQRDRWFFDAPGGTPVGGMPIWYGFISSVEKLGRTQATLKAKSDLALLNIGMPRNLFQPNCVYTVYSTGCGADKASFAIHDVVGASPTTTFIPWTSATAQSSLGTITFENGPNINLTRQIREAVPGVGLWLGYPLPQPCLVGDAFVTYPGCDRQYAGGCAFFGRQTAFRATEFVPQGEMAL